MVGKILPVPIPALSQKMGLEMLDEVGKPFPTPIFSCKKEPLVQLILLGLLVESWP